MWSLVLILVLVFLPWANSIAPSGPYDTSVIRSYRPFVRSGNGYYEYIPWNVWQQMLLRQQYGRAGRYEQRGPKRAPKGTYLAEKRAGIQPPAKEKPIFNEEVGQWMCPSGSFKSIYEDKMIPKHLQKYHWDKEAERWMCPKDSYVEDLEDEAAISRMPSEKRLSRVEGTPVTTRESATVGVRITSSEDAEEEDYPDAGGTEDISGSGSTVYKKSEVPTAKLIAHCRPDLKVVKINPNLESATFPITTTAHRHRLPIIQEIHLRDTANFVYNPPCVRIKRCGGCCKDPFRECRPTVIKEIEFRVNKTLHFSRRADGSECGIREEEAIVVLEQHGACSCQCKANSEAEAICRANPHLFLWDADECRCKCKPVKCGPGQRFVHEHCTCKSI